MKVLAAPRSVSAPGKDEPEATTGQSIYLTPRQLEVLGLLCEGLPNKLICRRLNISTGTVKVHISGILRVLGVTSRLQAVVAARQCGLLGDAGAADDAVPVEHAVASGTAHQVAASA